MNLRGRKGEGFHLNPRVFAKFYVAWSGARSQWNEGRNLLGEWLADASISRFVGHKMLTTVLHKGDLLIRILPIRILCKNFLCAVWILMRAIAAQPFRLSALTNINYLLIIKGKKKKSIQPAQCCTLNISFRTIYEYCRH